MSDQSPLCGNQQMPYFNPGQQPYANPCLNFNQGVLYGNSINQTAGNVPIKMAWQNQGNPNAFPNQGNPYSFPNQGNYNAFPNQGNPNFLPNQEPVSNYNTASNGYNGFPPYAQTIWYLNSQSPQNSLQMNSGQNQVALTTGNQQMQQFSHDNNSISRGGVTENPGMAVQSVTNILDAVANSIRGHGTKDPISLKLNIPKIGLEMSYEKGSENGSNVSSATEKE